MKKLLAILMIIATILSFAACGSKEPDTTSPDTAQTTEASVTEKAIVEEDEGKGEVKLSNSYLEFTIPEGFSYYISDANREAGESQFQVMIDIKNADGNKIGELLINNRGGYDNVDEYVQTDIDYYKDSESIKTEVVESAKYGIFDVRHMTVDRGYQVDNCYYGYYQIPDENAEYRNVRFELEIMGYYFKDVEFPKAECEAIMNSVVIK